jgi:hypothetical protein
MRETCFTMRMRRGNGRESFTCRKDNMSRTDEWDRTSYRTSSGKTSSVVGDMTARAGTDRDLTTRKLENHRPRHVISCGHLIVDHH